MTHTIRAGNVLRLLSAGALLALAPAVLGATNYTIATFADDAVVNGNCTLREALRAANFNLVIDACPAGGPADAIVLPSGTYPFSGEEQLAFPGTVSITSATLNPFNVTIDLQGAGRFLYINGGGPYTLGGLGILNGLAGFGGDDGGAIRAGGVGLTLFNFRFVSNLAPYAGGAVSFNSGADSNHYLTLHNGTFLTNQATDAAPSSTTNGGALSLSMQGGNHADLRDVSFNGNSATGGFVQGGALTVFAFGAGSSFDCVRCSFGSNSLVANASGANGYAAVSVQAGSGSAVSFRDSRFIGNSATAGAGAQAFSALVASATDNAMIEFERLFVDANLGPGGGFDYDMRLGVASGAIVWLLNSELTFGAANGLQAYLASAGNLRLGHLTIADYPGNGASIDGSNLGGAALQNSIVAFNDGTDLIDFGGALAQTGNFIGGNPLFLDEPNGNYRLSVASPAIDNGTNGTLTQRLADLDHGSRKVGLTTDIGCYEFNSLFADGFDVGDTGSWSSSAP
ncbi:MAG: CSLREA domain-containing protein [Thermoanaerobaculia bacterium]